MNLYYTTKHQLKYARWQLRRWRVSHRWGSDTYSKTPSVFANAMPKSGSHLIIQILRGLEKIGPFIDPGLPPVNRSEDNQKLPQDQIIQNIKRILPGDICYGYIHYREPFINLLVNEKIATLFIFRDPRDVLISHVFYAKDMHKGHGMHAYYNQVLQTMEQRINAAIVGVQENGASLAPIKEKYANYMGWLKIPNVLAVKFEDLVLERASTLDRMLDYIESRGYRPVASRAESIDVLHKAVVSHKSGTFRKGQPGNWRDHFTPLNKEVFKENTGDLLVMLGYEQDDRW